MNYPHNWLVLALLLSANTLANAQSHHEQQKINTVKKLYQNWEDSDYIKKIATPSLKKLMNLDSQIAQKRGEVPCINYDIKTQSQDPDKKTVRKTLSIQPNRYGIIQARFRIFPDTPYVSVGYRLICQGKTCLIDDVIEPGKQRGSLKKQLKQCTKA